jgi:tetracycline 7-halogenase / FADH2 O2-dependent halogenase
MNDYDIAITGRHLATGLLAAVLARSGLRTALIPVRGDGNEPAGETTVPYTAELFFLLGDRFRIPDISAMGTFERLPERLRRTCGAKRNLGFLYHRPGCRQNPAEAVQFNVPGEHAETHLFRPEADRYAAELAARHGAVLAPAEATPGGVRVGPEGVAVGLADGTEIRAEYLVSGTTDQRLLADDMQRSPYAGVRHRGRLLYTHLAGVEPFENLIQMRAYRKASPWSAGTLTHVFDGGWAQVTPFAGGRCGVAVSLDPRLASAVSAADGTPASEFRNLIQRFPDMRRQFATASPVQAWQVRENWPGWVEQCCGSRWFRFDRGAGRHDFLLSRDITMSLELVHAVAAGLLRLAESGDWAGGGMKEIADFQAGLFGCYDRMFAAGRAASRDFGLWNAFVRVWLLWTILSALSVKRARLDAAASGQWAALERFGQVPYWFAVPAGLPELIAESLADIEGVMGAEPADAAAGRIFARLRRERFVPPLYAFGDPEARYYYFTRMKRLRMLLWAKTTAPADFRRLLTADNVTAVPRQS